MVSPMERLFIVRVSAKGQVVIPKPIRKAYHINEGDEIFMIPVKEGILIKCAKKTTGLRGLLKSLKVDIAECEAILAEARKSLMKV